MKDTLRLITTYKCNRSCVGCCNKQEHNIASNVKVFDRLDYRTIILTGGEPMLFPHEMYDFAKMFKVLTGAAMILYTALPSRLNKSFMHMFDGITITLHEAKDIEPFFGFIDMIKDVDLMWKSLRVNIFKGVVQDDETIYHINKSGQGWVIKNNIEWIENCPIPSHEDLRRFKNLL